MIVCVLHKWLLGEYWSSAIQFIYIVSPFVFVFFFSFLFLILPSLYKFISGKWNAGFQFRFTICTFNIVVPMYINLLIKSGKWNCTTKPQQRNYLGTDLYMNVLRRTFTKDKRETERVGEKFKVPWDLYWLQFFKNL